MTPVILYGVLDSVAKKRDWLIGDARNPIENGVYVYIFSGPCCECEQHWEVEMQAVSRIEWMPVQRGRVRWVA